MSHSAMQKSAAPADVVSSEAPSQQPIPPALAGEWAKNLTDTQQHVLWRLTQGTGITDAAQATGVCRTTVHRWLKNDANFQASYHAWRQVLLESAQTRLMATLDQAVQTIRKAIADGNVAAALKLVEKLGAMQPPPPTCTDAEQLERRIAAWRADMDRQTRQLETQAKCSPFSADLPSKVGNIS